MIHQHTRKVANEIYRQITRKFGNWIKNLNVTIDGELVLPLESGKFEITKKGIIRLSGVVGNIQILTKIVQEVERMSDERKVVNGLRTSF